jgi:hypothetical protein
MAASYLLLGILGYSQGVAQCTADRWMEFSGSTLHRFPRSKAYFFVTRHMAVDADGAPNAYHPDDKGLDRLANAGFPGGNWTSILVADPTNSTQPFTQKSGPFVGFFLSRTTLEDRTRPATDAARYVDATQVPYFVFPSAFHRLAGTGTLGDLGIAMNLTSGETTPFVVADIGPAQAALGEVSIRLAEKLGGRNVSPRTGAGIPRGEFLYVVFPGSRRQPAWPVPAAEMDRATSDLLAATGGLDAIRACLASR